MECRHSGSPSPKKFRVQEFAGKVLTPIFWDQNGIVLIDYFPKGQTINAEYYSSLLVQLKWILKEERRGKITRGVLFFHDDALAHRTLEPRKNWVTWASSFLITHPILRIWTRRTTTFFLDWKKTIERSPFFVRRGGHCCRGDLVGRTTFRFSFWVACRS